MLSLAIAMKVLLKGLLVFTLVLLLIALPTDSYPEEVITVKEYSGAESVSISAPGGTVDVKGGEYIVQNNVWGAETSQTVTVPDIDVCSFNVTDSNHNQGPVASYPSIFKGSHFGLTTLGWQSYRISNLESATFNFSVSSYRPSGTYNVAAEAWFSSSSYTSPGHAWLANGGGELMIWIDSQGMVPAGSHIGDFGFYQVWFSLADWQDGHQYICYYKTGDDSADIDLLAFINDAMSRGYLNSSWYLHDIEAGFEICSDGEGLMLESFAASVVETDPATSTTSMTTDTTTTPTPTNSTPPDLNSILVLTIGGSIVLIIAVIVIRKK